MRSTAFMAHSRKDLVLVFVSALELVLIVYGSWRFTQLRSGAVLGLAAVLVFLNCTNFQCVAHNFLHNPFFRAQRLNALFSVFNSLALGVPQTLYRFQHLHHHKYNNDAKDARTGTTRDQSSTYRFASSPTGEEHILGYALLGPFRTNFGHFLTSARKQGQLGLVIAESLALCALCAALLRLNWRGFVLFFLPVWYFGEVLALAENYLEHHLALPGNRLTDSVSCYGKLYNWVWFNNGYHQEHHFRPQFHWTRVRELRAQMRPDGERRVVAGAHWFNFDFSGSSKAAARVHRRSVSNGATARGVVRIGDTERP